MALQDYCKKGYRPIANLAFELDLSQLNHNVILYQNVSTPPSTKSTVTEINICNALQHTQHKDECKEGTYLCQKIVYSQKSVDFVAEVHARVGDFEKSKLKTRFEPMDLSKDSRENGYRYRLTLSTHDQQAQITLECDTHQARKAMASLPTLVSYHHHALIFEWKTPWACSIEKEDDQASKRPIEPEQEGLSAICLFFILAKKSDRSIALVCWVCWSSILL
ncbi:autophagy-related protein 27-domain-containing protein [Sporodiniella umbellata]|nr:autophagy-related protein 27-domain-containing protein [Sporodiniella umbellata]